MCKKNFIPITIGFCVIALQSYREILKKYRTREINQQTNNVPESQTTIFASIMRNGVSIFESSRLHGVARTVYTHTAELHKYVIPKKKSTR